MSLVLTRTDLCKLALLPLTGWALLIAEPITASADLPCQQALACHNGDTVSVVVKKGGGIATAAPRPPGPRDTDPESGGSSKPSRIVPPPPPAGSHEPTVPLWATTGGISTTSVHARPADTPCATGEGQTPKLSCVNYTPAPPAPTMTTPASGTATAPAAPAAPTYTAEQAATQAWTTQTFTKATVAIQPAGNTTLTGLPTYFQATYGPDGLAPGETTTVTLLGHTITLRPTDVTYTYHYGDTATYGPTTDAGGPYPTGNVTHTYPTKGTVTTRIDTTLSGQYQENNGPWHTIPGATTITGQPQQLTIATLQSRLHH